MLTEAQTQLLLRITKNSFKQVQQAHESGQFILSYSDVSQQILNDLEAITIKVPQARNAKIRIEGGMQRLLALGFTSSRILKHNHLNSQGMGHFVLQRSSFSIEGDDCATQLDRLLNERGNGTTTTIDCYRSLLLVFYITLRDFLRDQLGQEEGDKRFNILFNGNIGITISGAKPFGMVVNDQSTRVIFNSVPLTLAYFLVQVPNSSENLPGIVKMVNIAGHPDYSRNHPIGAMGGQWALTIGDAGSAKYLAPGISDAWIQKERIIEVLDTAYKQPTSNSNLTAEDTKYLPQNVNFTEELGNQSELGICLNPRILALLLGPLSNVRKLADDLRSYCLYQRHFILAAHKEYLVSNDQNMIQLARKLVGSTNPTQIVELQFPHILTKLCALSHLPLHCDAESSTGYAIMLLMQIIQYFRTVVEYSADELQSVGFIYTLQQIGISDLLSDLKFGKCLRYTPDLFYPDNEVIKGILDLLLNILKKLIADSSVFKLASQAQAGLLGQSIQTKEISIKIIRIFEELKRHLEDSRTMALEKSTQKQKDDTPSLTQNLSFLNPWFSVDSAAKNKLNTVKLSTIATVMLFTSVPLVLLAKNFVVPNSLVQQGNEQMSWDFLMKFSITVLSIAAGSSLIWYGLRNHSMFSNRSAKTFTEASKTFDSISPLGREPRTKGL